MRSFLDRSSFLRAVFQVCLGFGRGTETISSVSMPMHGLQQKIPSSIAGVINQHSWSEIVRDLNFKNENSNLVRSLVRRHGLSTKSGLIENISPLTEIVLGRVEIGLELPRVFHLIVHLFEVTWGECILDLVGLIKQWSSGAVCGE